MYEYIVVFHENRFTASIKIVSDSRLGMEKLVKAAKSIVPGVGIKRIRVPQVAMEEGFRGLVAELLDELDGSYGHAANMLIESIRERLNAKPFWPKCGLCGKPINLESEAEEFWTGPINSPGGSKGYIHVGRGECLRS